MMENTSISPSPQSFAMSWLTKIIRELEQRLRTYRTGATEDTVPDEDTKESVG